MIVDSALYVDGVRAEGHFDPAEAAGALRGHDAFAWIGLFEPTRAEFGAVRRHVALPDVVVEDAFNAHVRPKLERFGDDLFVVLRTARYLDDVEDVEFGEIEVFVTPRVVVHVRHNAPAKLVGVRAELEARTDLLRCGPGAVLLAIVEHVLDGYTPVLDGLEQDVREVERQVFTQKAGENPVERIYGLMRTVLRLQDAIEPLNSPVSQLAQRELASVHPDLRHRFEDAGATLATITARTDTLHDVLTSVLAANLTRVSIRQNEDMRKISAWVAIAAVPTMIAGIYGMNFEHMPELSARLGYPMALAFMGAVCYALYRKFRSSGWL